MQAKQQQQPTFVEVSSGTQTISSANFMVWRLIITSLR